MELPGSQHHFGEERISGFWYGVRQRNFQFEPQVLRVCKQLEKEGMSVLYKENALTVHILDDPEEECLYVAALEYEFAFDYNGDKPDITDGPMPIPVWLLQIQGGMRSFVLEVKIPWDGYDCTGITWAALKYLIMPMTGNKLGSSVLKINIEISETDEARDTSEGRDPDFQNTLSDFSILHEYRCRKLCVTVNGEPYHPAWATKMTSKEPIFLLSEAKERLDQCLQDTTHIELPGSNKSELLRAMSQWDVGRFKRARREALGDLAAEHEAEIERHESAIKCDKMAIELLKEASRHEI